MGLEPGTLVRAGIVITSSNGEVPTQCHLTRTMTEEHQRPLLPLGNTWVILVAGLAFQLI